MRNLKQQLSVALIQLLLLGSFSIASAQSSDGMQWSVTPYMWASDTTVDLTTDFSFQGPMAGFNFRF